MTAIQANYCDLKLIKTRKVMQLVLEVPLEHAQKVTETLGWPDPTAESWVAVARLTPEAAKTESQQTYIEHAEQRAKRRPWHELKPSQQCALLCKNERFRDWLKSIRDGPWPKDLMSENTEGAAAEAVRRWVGVRSRSEIDKEPQAAARWQQLYDNYVAISGQMAEQR